jgi:6-pyruvoyltetrahydropterin/6-carboxytetrahydropterin synthase
VSDIVSISKEVEFDAGHRVPNHKSKCRNPHGHRYRVRVHAIGHIVEEPGASDEGMLVDFSDLKALMQTEIHDVLDHSFIVHINDEEMRAAIARPDWNVVIFPYIPTAENIARWCWEVLVHKVETKFRDNLELQMVEVWETPTSCAKYWGMKEDDASF